MQEIDSIEYNIHSKFTARAPNRVDLPSRAMSADIFSKYILVNVCPGEQLFTSRTKNLWQVAADT